MELWFSETFADIRAAWRVREVLYHRRSAFQDIAVVDTLAFGRMLVLDGCVMTTEKDECAYHEMLVHPGLLAHPEPVEVCVVGGGDGGTVREVLKHATVQRVVLAEIDEDVINACREYFPGLAGCLTDPRVEVSIGDGAKYLDDHPRRFDAIFSDSTDPVGPGEVLFADSYFGSAKLAVRGNGLFVTQCKSVWVDAKGVRDVAQRLRRHFGRVLPYTATIPTYPSGSWSFLFAADSLDPRTSFSRSRQAQLSLTSRYYTPEHQTAAFAMPAFCAREE